jgi:hypothetical protein
MSMVRFMTSKLPSLGTAASLALSMSCSSASGSSAVPTG